MHKNKRAFPENFSILRSIHKNILTQDENIPIANFFSSIFTKKNELDRRNHINFLRRGSGLH